MTMKTRSATALLMLTAAVAACGGTASTPSPVTQGRSTAPTQASPAAGATAQTAPTAPAAPGAATNACALITQQEATAFLGFDPGPGTDTGSADSPACAYGASLTIGVELNDGKTLFATLKSAMPGTAQDLTGVGDAGFVFIVANTVAQMSILKGSTLLTVNVQGDPSKANITVAALTALGTIAVGRL